MKYFIPFIAIFLFLFSCSSSNTEAEGEYELYKKGYVDITDLNIVNLNYNDQFCVELMENGSTAYLWKYKINGNIEFIDEQTFNFNPNDLIGGDVNHIWRFENISNSQSSLEFTKQHVGDSTDIVEQKVFVIN